MTQQQYRKKLIEVAMPLEAINAASAREKSIRHGHPSTLHLWWARRPLAACRAVLFGQLVDDPSGWPERFPTEQAQEEERKRLFGLIEQFVQWENSTNEHVLNAARYEIARSLAWNRGEEPPAKANPKAVLDWLQEHAPPVYDPFCGGGSIPLEAQRLGLRAYGSDLNPVAVLISKALVEIPPKFANLPPINPARDPHKRWKGAQGLAEDVRYYGQWMRDEAAKRIGHLYPQVEVTERAVREQPSLKPLQGQKLTVIAWLWARTVASPNPAAKGSHVPLASSFMLSTKEGKKAWVEPMIDPTAREGYRFVVRSGRIARDDEAKAKPGNKASRGSFLCILTAAPMTYSYIDDEANAGRMDARLMAVVAEGKRGRVYLSPTDDQEEIARSARPDWRPEQQCRGTFASNAQGRIYGFKTFGDYFTPRQLVALTTFSDLVSEARDNALTDARAAGLPDGRRLADGGTGAEAYADAVATYLAFAISKCSTRSCSLTIWESGMGRLAGAMGRQALPMQWSFAETNPFAGAGGDIAGTAVSVAENLDNLGFGPAGSVRQTAAQAEDRFQLKVLVSTDPPYYDNIGYADLSDFFYVWLRRSIGSVWQELFRTVLVPKSEELIATPYRHGSREAAERFFMEGMTRALSNIAANVYDCVPLAIYYAFKQSEIAHEGIASTGWASFLQALVEAGLVVDGTWPMRTEATNALKANVNALASSIILICRKRQATAKVTTRAEFLKALKSELPAALKLLQHGNIAPVDMAQASIGPGMAIFTRYAKVLEANDNPMLVKTALQLINAALDEFLSEQEAEYEAHTRFAITWFETHGMATATYGAAETLATARNVSVSGAAEAGLIDARGGKVRLLPRSEMPADWDPSGNGWATVWEATQHLIRCLETEGEQSAADLLRRLDNRAGAARDLAYRLYQICERKKWAEEGRAYNGLVIAWPELVKLAQATPENLLI